MTNPAEGPCSVGALPEYDERVNSTPCVGLDRGAAPPGLATRRRGPPFSYELQLERLDALRTQRDAVGTVLDVVMTGRQAREVQLRHGCKLRSLLTWYGHALHV